MVPTHRGHRLDVDRILAAQHQHAGQPVHAGHDDGAAPGRVGEQPLRRFGVEQAQVLDSGEALVDVLVALRPAIAMDPQIVPHEQRCGGLGEPGRPARRTARPVGVCSGDVPGPGHGFTAPPVWLVARCHSAPQEDSFDGRPPRVRFIVANTVRVGVIEHVHVTTAQH